MHKRKAVLFTNQHTEARVRKVLTKDQLWTNRLRPRLQFVLYRQLLPKQSRQLQQNRQRACHHSSLYI